jgi:hypothetical protein
VISTCQVASDLSNTLHGLAYLRKSCWHGTCSGLGAFEGSRAVKINPIATVIPTYLPSTTAPNIPSAKPAPPIARVFAAPTTSSSHLSDETKKGLIFAAQALEPHGAPTNPKVPPAQQARAALAADPSLAAFPFGAIVSALARGEPLPVATSSSEPDVQPATDPVVEEPIIDPVDDTAESVGATALDLIGEELETAPVAALEIDELFDPLEPLDGL